MGQISIDVSQQQKDKKKALNLKWSNILQMGFETSENAEKVYILNSEILRLQRELQDIKIDYMVRGKRLQAYIEKYGLDDNIMFRKDFKEAIIKINKDD